MTAILFHFTINFTGELVLLDFTGEIINTIILLVITSGIIYWNLSKERMQNGTNRQSQIKT